MHVDVKDLPEPLKSAVRHVTGMKSVVLEVGDTFDAPGAYGKGYRGQVLVVNISTGERQYVAGSWGGANPFRQSPVDDPMGRSPLPPGFAALTTGGRVWTLHLNPANVANLLPAPAESHDLTLREMWLLWSYRALTSAGRKDEWERSTSRDNPVGGPPSQAEIAELARKGVITVNRAGAAQITTLGRNIIGGMSDYAIVEKARASSEGRGREASLERSEFGGAGGGRGREASLGGSRPPVIRHITAEELLAPIGVKPAR